MKRLFVYFSFALVCNVCFAFQHDGLDYTILNRNADGSYNVSVRKGATAPEGVLSLRPSFDYNGDTFIVTHVADDGFNECSGITRLILPNTIVELGSRAFRSCTGLTTVTLNEGLRVIGNRAFCNDATISGTFTIPSTVDSIGDYAFFKCDNVTVFDIQTETPPAIEKGQKAVFIHADPLPEFRIVCGSWSLYAQAYYWGEKMSWLKDECRTFEAGDLRYESTGPTTCRVLGFVEGATPSGSNLNIPATVVYAERTLSVTEIGNNAFNECKVEFTSLVLPSTLRVIGGYAFRSCTQLTSVQLNEGLRVIGNRAFCNNSALVWGDLVIPSTVDSIGDYAFYKNQLTGLKLLSPEIRLESGTGKTVFNSYNGAIQIPCGSWDTYYKDAACWNIFRSQLQDPCQENFSDGVLVYHPNGVGTAKVVGYEAGKINGELIIPAEVTYNGFTLVVNEIGENVFNEKGVPLTAVVLPPSMRVIGTKAFRSCTQLTSVQLNEGLRVIGNRAFCNDAAISGTFTIPSTVDSIGNYAFYGVNGVEKIEMLPPTPPALEDNGAQVFALIDNGKVHLLCGSKEDYQENAAWQYYLNKGVVIDFCDNFTVGALVYKATMPGYAKVVGFVPELLPENLNVPETVTINGSQLVVNEIGEYVFNEKGVSLKSLVLPSSMRVIGKQAFRSCTQLTSVQLNEGLRVIGNRAFCNDSALVGTIVIPASVELLGDYAFGTNKNVWKHITEVKLLGMTPPSIEVNADGWVRALNGISSDVPITIPCGSKTAYTKHNLWRQFSRRYNEDCPHTPLDIYHWNYPNVGYSLTRYGGGKVTNISYYRIFTPDVWETLYLPFDVESIVVYEGFNEYDINIPYGKGDGGGGYFYLAKQVGNDAQGEPVFEDATKVEANVPYIIRFPTDFYKDRTIIFKSDGKPKTIVNPSFSQAEQTDAQIRMYGNTTWSNQNVTGVYMLSNDNIFHIHNEEVVLHPFECYVTLPVKTGTVAAPAQRMMIHFRKSGGVTTDHTPIIEKAMSYTVEGNTLTIQTQGEALNIYTIDGRLVCRSEAGQTMVSVTVESGCYIIQTQYGSQKIVL